MLEQAWVQSQIVPASHGDFLYKPNSRVPSSVYETSVVEVFVLLVFIFYF